MHGHRVREVVAHPASGDSLPTRAEADGARAAADPDRAERLVVAARCAAIAADHSSEEPSQALPSSCRISARSGPVSSAGSLRIVANRASSVSSDEERGCRGHTRRVGRDIRDLDRVRRRGEAASARPHRGEPPGRRAPS